MKLEITISEEDLRDLLVTAVEGGSNYWATFSEIQRDGDKNILSVLVVEQEESDKERVMKTVTPQFLLTGLQKLIEAEFENAKPCMFRIWTGNYDSVDADVALQMTVFGELVYG